MQNKLKFKRIKEKLLNNNLVTDSFWALFGNIIAKGLALIAGIFIARFLGKDVFGEFGIIKSTLLTISVFSTFGLGYSATKYIAENKENRPEIITIVLKYSYRITFIVSSILAFSLFIFSDYFSTVILESSKLSTPLKIVSLYIVFNATNTTQIGIISGFGAFKEMARINTIIGIAGFFTTVILTYFLSLNGALLGLLIVQILNWILNNKLIKHYSKQFVREKDVSEIEEKKILNEILKFSFPISLQEITYSISALLSSLLLIKYSNYGEIGVYSAALQWGTIILFIPGILRNVILSHLSKINNDKTELKGVLKTILLFNFIMTFLPFVCIFVFSNYIAEIYGVGYIGLHKVINIVVFTAIFISLSNVYSQAFLSLGKSFLIFKMRFVRDVGVLCLAFLLFYFNIELNGALVLAYSGLVFNIVFFILVSIYYPRVVRGNNNFEDK